MFCSQCGTKLPADARFCMNCGTVMQESDAPAKAEPTEQIQHTLPDQPPEQPMPVPQEYQPPPPPEQYPQAPQEYQPPPPPEQYPQAPQEHYPQPDMYKQQPVQPLTMAPPEADEGFFKKWWKVIVPAGVVVVAGAVAAILFLTPLSPFNSPLRTAAKALSNLVEEIGVRTQDTPLEMFGILIDSIQNGSVSVGFDYSDGWSDARGNFTLHTDVENGDYALEADFTIDGFRLDLDLYMNSERVAARVAQIDRSFYGIRYDTFREDFRSFGDLIGFSRQDMDMIADAVDAISDMMNAGSDASDALFAEFEKLMTDFISDIEVSSKRVDMPSGWDTVKATKIEFIITADMIIGLLEDFLKALENDDTIRSWFDLMDSYQDDYWNTGSTYDEMLREINNALRDMKRNFNSDFSIALYVGKGDRLLRIELNTEIEIDRDMSEISIMLDFGTSAHAIWFLETNVVENGVRTGTAFEWAMRETSRGGEASLSFIEEIAFGVVTTELILEWTDRGAITLSVIEYHNREEVLTGMYTSNGDGFRLTIDDPNVSSYYGERMDLEITVSRRSGQIPEIDYTNISEWGTQLIEKIEEFIYSFAGSYDPFPAYPDPGYSYDPGMSDHGLIGAWEFSSGDSVYYFWQSGYIEFHPDGWVYTEDGGYGTWMVDGNLLMVVDDYGSSYQFYIEIWGDTIFITDEDNDMGIFERY